VKITRVRFYGGSREKTCRLGLADLFLGVIEILLETPIEVLEEQDANGAAHVRERLDAGFVAAGGWKQQKTGGVDWVKEARYGDQVTTRLGVEIQVSARSDLLIRDVVHLRNSLQEAAIDVGLIVVPDDRLQRFLPDRTPSFTDALRYIEQEFKEAMTYPIVVLAVEHDRAGAALPKKKRRS
jgi:hypothetical protein